MEILLSGMSYKELPDTYVIFICDFDPYGKGKYRYTRKAICEEEPELLMEDGTHTEEVPPELVRFLEFVRTPLQDSDKDFNDDFIRKLQESIREVKASREMGARYMTFEEYLKEEREEAREEGLQEGEKNKLINQVKKKLAKGQSVEEIADALEETVETVQEIIDEFSKM